MAGSELPKWSSVLAVVAHPDDEPFGLGALLSAFADSGAAVSVLCLTRGEASTLHGVPGELGVLRAKELHDAAAVLGVGSVRLCDYPDAALADIALETLAAEVTAFAREVAADGLLGFDLDGVTGHPDHHRATEAAITASQALEIGVLGWALPAHVATTLASESGGTFIGRQAPELDLVVPVDRSTQLQAVACHPSQAVPGSVLWRRLELLGPLEHLRWLAH